MHQSTTVNYPLYESNKLFDEHSRTACTFGGVMSKLEMGRTKLIEEITINQHKAMISFVDYMLVFLSVKFDHATFFLICF